MQIVFPRRAGITFRGDTKFELQIEDDDPKEVKLELSKSRLEERIPGDAATLVALLPAPAEEDVTLPLTLGGSAEAKSDFDVSATSLVIRAGEHRGQVTFTVRDDNRPEGTEYVEIHVASATALKINSAAEFKIEIVDDEIEGRALVLLLATSYMGQRTAEFQRRLEYPRFAPTQPWKMSSTQHSKCWARSEPAARGLDTRSLSPFFCFGRKRGIRRSWLPEQRKHGCRRRPSASKSFTPA